MGMGRSVVAGHSNTRGGGGSLAFSQIRLLGGGGGRVVPLHGGQSGGRYFSELRPVRDYTIINSGAFWCPPPSTSLNKIKTVNVKIATN